MTLEARNKRALAEGQAAYDNASPPEHDGREDYIDDQVDELMRYGACGLVPFFSYKLGTVTMNQGFGEIGSERLAEADTRDCELLQIVLACLNGEHEKAQKLAYYFDGVLRDAARKLVEAAMDKESGE